VLEPSGKYLIVPEVVAGQPIVFGFNPSQVVFLQFPVADDIDASIPNKINARVNAKRKFKWCFFILPLFIK
jgi:hypothetical protein